MSRSDPALVERAVQFQQAGRFAEAEALWRHLAGANPTDAALPFNLGLVLAAQNRHADALAWFERTTVLAPKAAEAFVNLGVTRQRLGQLDEAMASYRQAMALQPDLLHLQNNLAGALQELGLSDEALDLYRKIDAATDDPSLATNLLTVINLVPGSLSDGLAMARRWASRFAESPPPVPAVTRRPGERLRVGYVGGPGLRRHTLALTWLPLLEAHDATRVEIFAYSDLPENLEDDVSRRFQKVATWRRSPQLGPRELADLVRRDGIHVLVDGIGFAAGCRLQAFGLRPAPVQVHFPPMSTTGLSAMDYILADHVLIPGDAAQYFQERIWELPCGFLYSPIEVLPPPAMPARGPPHGAITFGSFNRLAKIGPDVVATWSRILRAVPGSRLVIKTGSVLSAGMLERYRRLFASHGVPAEAVEFRPRTVTDQAHYEMLNDLDIALDPFPHGGVLTTCDALAAGIPVVTLAGTRPLERYSASILSAAGFSEGIATSLDDYVDRATALARSGRLEGLRSELSLHMRRSPLMDAPRFARSVEEAYEGMWQQHCAGPKPRQG